MNKLKKLADGLFVSGYVFPQELPSLAGEVRTIINNRPDAEEPGQPTSGDLEAAAQKLGLRYLFIPVEPGKLTNEKIAQFSEALTKEPQPVLAFCKSGMRSTALWALSQAGKADPESILGAAAAAGYDLRGLSALAG